MRNTVTGVLLVLLASSAVAEPVADHLEPPSVVRGQRNKLAVIGKEIDRPLGIWTSLPPDKIQVVTAQSADASRANLELEVAADCPLGIYGLRLATEDGLSDLQLFAVDDLVLRTNLEAVQREFPVAVSRQFRNAEVDRFPIEVAAQQKLSFDVIASRLGTDADPLITIYDAMGRRIFERDNDPGLFFDCCFEYAFEKTGVYTVEVRDSRFQGSPHWHYVLRMGNFPAACVALPSAVQPGAENLLRFPQLAGVSSTFAVPADQPLGSFFHAWRRPGDTASGWVQLLNTQQPSVLEVEPNGEVGSSTAAQATPVFLHGNFEQPGDKDFFGLELKKGDRLAIRVETKGISSAADVELSVVDPTGRELQRVDDLQLPGGALEEASLTFSTDRDGQYCVVVREVTGASGPEYAYRVEVQRAQPRIAIVAELSAFAVPQGSYQSLPLTVTRTDYNGPIQLTLVDAPPGISLEPAMIPEGSNSITCRLAAAANATAGISSFGINAQAQAGETLIAARVTAQPLVDRQLISVDLIKHALRDNQRYLPPSVKERLALQITPAIPFGVEPAQPTVVLPRYLQSALQIQTTRQAGFEAPITFSATGGQLGEESEGRKQVFARIAPSQGNAAATIATFHTRSQANEAKERVDISASTIFGTRRVTLIRSINLHVQPGFEIALEPMQLTLEPGQTTKVKLTAKRLPGFDGPVTIRPTTFAGVTVPELITIAPGETVAEVEIVVAATCQPRRDRVRFPATGQVGAFQEEPRQAELDLDVKLPAPRAK